jgi:serine/threonine protein kinase
VPTHAADATAAPRAGSMAHPQRQRGALFADSTPNSCRGLQWRYNAGHMATACDGERNAHTTRKGRIFMQAWRLGSYEVVRPLGEGGMAQVYLARDVRLGREVAVKVLDSTLAGRSGFKERFLREARVAAALDHPHIVPLYDFGETDGQLYLVMPFVSGGSLQDMLRKTPLPVGDVVTYGAQMADALAYAHERGVVHRDVKPANMLLHADGRLLLSDFGLAKILTPESRARAPRNQPDAGTPEYMAPEQIEGQTDERSDIYALGVVLYLLLTGRLPFTGHSSNAVMGGHLYRLPEEPRRLNPAVTPAMQTVIMQALAKHPDDRFQRASDLAAALLNALVAGDAEPLPFLLSNPSPAPPLDPAVSFPAPPRLTPPTISPARASEADASGVLAFAPPPPVPDDFELPQLGAPTSRSQPVPEGGASPVLRRAGSTPVSLPTYPQQAASPTPATHYLTGMPGPSTSGSPAFPFEPATMPSLDLSAPAHASAASGVSRGRRQSLVQPPVVAPVIPPAPPAPDRPIPAPPAPPAMPSAKAQVRLPNSADESDGGGLRKAIVWIVVLLVLMALIAGLVIHLAQIHSGTAVLPGAVGRLHAAFGMLAALGTV